MKKRIKLTFKLLGILLILPLVCVLCAFVLSSIPNRFSKSTGDEKIYLVSNGVHTDIVFNRSDFTELEGLGMYIEEGDQFISIGWGDRGFYLDTPTWGDLTLKTAINAGFLKSETLMHITRFANKNTKWKEVQLDSIQLSQLKSYISSHFKKNNQKVAKIENAHYGKNDEFYEAEGSYSIFKTCNTWVNNGLKHCNVKTAIWTPFDYGILKWYQ